MNDNDLVALLRRGAGRAELPVDVADRVQGAMHAELDRALGSEDAPDDVGSPSVPRRRRLDRVAAAVILVVGVAGLLVVQREPDLDKADLAEEVPPPPPSEVAYLTACLEFIDSSSIDGRPWNELLAAPPLPPEYPSTLAASIDTLLARSPETRIASSQLRSAADELRSADPDLDLVVGQLESAQNSFYAETLILCITAPNDDQPTE